MLRLVTLTSLVASAASHAFKDCPADLPGGGTTGQVPFTAINLNPDPPAAGQDLKIEFTTDPVKVAITGGHGDFKVKLHGIQLLSETIDTCTKMGLACPIAAGSSLQGMIEYTLPSEKLPSYLDLDCFFQVVDENGKTLDCVYVVVNEANYLLGEMTNNATTISDGAALFIYESWKKQYVHEVTVAPKEEQQRFKQFTTNFQMVDAHNQRYKDGKETYTMSMNAFAHLSWEEFRSMYIVGGLQHEESLQLPRDVHSVAPNATLPASIDWSKKGAVTSIKNQGQCGSCWAFSTTGSIEGAYFLKTGNLRDFSEQQLVDCDLKKDKGCNGGLMDNAFDFVASNGGLCQESDYPYTGVQGACAKTCTDVAGTAVSKHTDVNATAEDLMSAIAQQPVSIAIEADQRGFQFYNSGVFSGSCGTKLDHGVLAVGYGVMSQMPYWKVKNSWGESWGNNGFINIERNKKQKGGQCGILNSASYPTL